MKDARVWIICDLLYDLTINLVLGLNYAFLAIAHEPLNGTERAHNILVERPCKVKHRYSKRAMLPSHFPNRYLALEDEASALRQEVILRGLGLDELPDVRGEAVW
jgi:hypothetical protein